jgi:hypothetical protein
VSGELRSAHAGEVVCVLVAPALELPQWDEHELPARDEFDDGLDAALEGVDAHS